MPVASGEPPPSYHILFSEFIAGIFMGKAID
jgi:hypothetical protein